MSERTRSFESDLNDLARGNGGPTLRDGGRVAVMGGGPAGSFFSYFFLEMARRIDLSVELDIYEPRDFSGKGPASCNMCGGIISETLVQNLAGEGINLPPTVVQRGIDSYVLHTDLGSVRIDTPLQEKRIGAVHRASGPRDLKEAKWGSFDGFLQGLAVDKGANLKADRIQKIEWREGQPLIETKGGETASYDLLVVAIGVNSPSLKLFETLDLPFRQPHSTKTFIREYYLGPEKLAKHLGSSMHVFLLNVPRLEFAAIIPKGDYASVCLLGEDIDQPLLKAFLDSPQVKALMPEGWESALNSCQCAPKINTGGARQPFADRLVFIGDAGVTRLYKDGIGAAYRTAKAAASTAVFQGVGASDFEKHYWPLCQRIERDNSVGRFVFNINNVLRRATPTRAGILRMTASEQGKRPQARRMSTVMWDLFTGSASYTEVLRRTVDPRFIASYAWNVLASVTARGPAHSNGPGDRVEERSRE